MYNDKNRIWNLRDVTKIERERETRAETLREK